MTEKPIENTPIAASSTGAAITAIIRLPTPAPK